MHNENILKFQSTGNALSGYYSIGEVNGTDYGNWSTGRVILHCGHADKVTQIRQLIWERRILIRIGISFGISISRKERLFC